MPKENCLWRELVLEYSKELDMLVRSIVKEEINGKHVTIKFCDERFNRVMQKMNEIDEFGKKLDRIHSLIISILVGIFSTLIAILLRFIG